jgi:hypothetical protein
MEIKIKEGINLDTLNAELEKRGINGHFITEQETNDWLNDINCNPDSPQKHLKPKERNLTADELKDIFPKWTETGLFETDLYYGRTPKKEMQHIVEFINGHQYDIEHITDVETLIERGEISSATFQSVLRLLEKPEEINEEYPEEEQAKQCELQGGHLLCKSWGPNPFWVVYGSVKRPQFLKERKYVDNDLNSLYRDDQGRGYLLIPLYDFSLGFFEKVYKEAWEMGLREHPAYFIPCCYSFKIQDIKETAQSFFEFYSLEELTERFQHVITQILHNAELLNLEVTWKATGIAVRTKAMPKEELVLVANALMLAIKMHYGALKRAFIGQVVTTNTVLTFAKGRVALEKA